MDVELWAAPSVSSAVTMRVCSVWGPANGVQFRAHGGDRLAVVRLHADVDIVSGDGACVVDGKFHVACPRATDRCGTGGRVLARIHRRSRP